MVALQDDNQMIATRTGYYPRWVHSPMMRGIYIPIAPSEPGQGLVLFEHPPAVCILSCSAGVLLDFPPSSPITCRAPTVLEQGVLAASEANIRNSSHLQQSVVAGPLPLMVSFASAALPAAVETLASWPALAAQPVLLAASVLVWRYFLSPLRDVPGPFLAKLTRLWHIHRILKGDQNLALVALHDKYGTEVSTPPLFLAVTPLSCFSSVFASPPLTPASAPGPFVRVAPDEVSVGHPDAVRKLFLAPLTKGYWYAGIAIPDWRYVSPMAILEPRAKMELSKALSPGYALCKFIPRVPLLLHIEAGGSGLSVEEIRFNRYETQPTSCSPRRP